MKRRSILAMLSLAPVAAVPAESAPRAGANPDAATAVVSAVHPPLILENGQLKLNPAHVQPLIEKALREYDRNVLPARLHAAIDDPRARG